ncbi:MAG: metal-dependent hydrolase [Anaerolineales bacterium]|nr:MAG: metal-dependent hydrolase [Anaerolineales bacterium]
MEQIITWLGHGSWRMVTPKGTIIYLDPWIEGNPACPITLDDIGQAQVVCVTHGHSDHLGNAIEIVHKTGATLVTLPEVAAYCSNYGIPYDDHGGCVHTGGSVVQKDVRIHAVFALHSSDIMGKEYAESNQLMPGSGTCGMILTPEDGVPVYFAGDTGVFGDMALIGKLYRPRVAVLPIGGKYTMGVREAAYAMELLGSEVLIPGHYNTFPGQMADTDDLIRQVAVRCPEARVVVLKPGESFTV